ncbi:DsbA family oxidoreductase [Acinetobacter bereziniae]|uniref:DsbA family oxidoreductase n=1 Tax=Acinetobacter bereziniae TaxID=106648 RepID=UPI00286B36D3|nr:DsbA family oxidoreductase [Acinetobacter bereziniae]
MMKQQLSIEMFFDFICPWCLIGKRELHNAIKKLKKSHPDVEVLINWRGVQLLPLIPTQGVPFKAFYLQRLGSATAVRILQGQVRQAAQSVGVDIDFDLIPRMPNTGLAHDFFQKAAKISCSVQTDRLLEAIISAYFNHSEHINQLDVLMKIASYCGFSEEMIKAILVNKETPFVSADTGGKGVPYFIFGGRLAIAGAQQASVLYRGMLEMIEMQGQCV